MFYCFALDNLVALEIQWTFVLADIKGSGSDLYINNSGDEVILEV